MPLALWVPMALVTEFALTCALLRWLPTRRERWVAVLPFPVGLVLVLALRLVAGAPWPVAFATCAGFLWGALLALAAFRGWVSSWTLPVSTEERLRWRDTALVAVGVLTPLAVRRTDQALEKAFAERRVPRARGGASRLPWERRCCCSRWPPLWGPDGPRAECGPPGARRSRCSWTLSGGVKPAPDTRTCPQHPRRTRCPPADAGGQEDLQANNTCR